MRAGCQRPRRPQGGASEARPITGKLDGRSSERRTYYFCKKTVIYAASSFLIAAFTELT
jgi:hypothetical protein